MRLHLSAVQKKNPYLSIIDGENDIAISFNYTETLEKVYEMKASNICYVHGQREMNPVLQMKKKMLSFGKENFFICYQWQTSKGSTGVFFGKTY